MTNLNTTTKIITIVILTAITWSSSLTNEYIGYDDIKLIANNNKVKQGISYSIQSLFFTASQSDNVAWSNEPTAIYRPIEGINSAIAYKLWGNQPIFYHLFFNFLLHILNTILLFLILSKVLNGLSVRGNIAWLATLFWSAHPIHDEVVNMLTSGLGFLFAMFTMLASIYIMMNIDSLNKAINIVLLLLAGLGLYISHLGSEHTVLAPFLLAVVTLAINQGSFKERLFGCARVWKILTAFMALIAYLVHRATVIANATNILPTTIGEFNERLFVLAPQILMHYIKLCFYPIPLSIDQHHQVYLANAFSPYHILCLSIAVALVATWIYGVYRFIQQGPNQLSTIAIFIFISFISIAITLNVFPVYVLARQRYSYLFSLALIVIVILLIQALLAKFSIKPKYISIALVIVFISFSIKAFTRSLDWRNGEKFWQSTIESCNDNATKIIWGYRLLAYYNKPGTETYKVAPEKIKQLVQSLYTLSNQYGSPEIFKNLKDKANDPKNYLLNKYGYSFNKTAAAALSMHALLARSNNLDNEALESLLLARLYYPEHFQTNYWLYIYLANSKPELAQSRLEVMKQLADNNAFLAKRILDALNKVADSDIYETAKYYKNKFPKIPVFDLYLYFAAKQEGDNTEADAAKKRLVGHKYLFDDLAG